MVGLKVVVRSGHAADRRVAGQCAVEVDLATAEADRKVIESVLVARKGSDSLTRRKGLVLHCAEVAYWVLGTACYQVPERSGSMAQRTRRMAAVGMGKRHAGSEAQVEVVARSQESVRLAVEHNFCRQRRLALVEVQAG